MSLTRSQVFLSSGRSHLRTVLTTLSLAFALGCSSLALAQTFYKDPPKDFDAVRATDQDRAQYGFPPAPDQSETAAYASWVKMVTTRQTRFKDTTTQITNFRHNPAQHVQTQGAVVGNATAATSQNWSGFAATSATNTFTNVNNYVYAQWVVPAVGAENCADAPIGASQWVGFDGFGSADVLQAGTAITACGTSYVAWYEWATNGCTTTTAALPCNQVNFSLPVNPGDLIDTEVWYTTAADHGHAYILNVSTGVSVSVSFDQPPGSSGTGYKADSVEWVVERPCYGTGPSTCTFENLLNYASVVMNEAHAYGSNGYFYPSSSPAGTTIYDLTMTCPAWKPTSACTTTTDLSFANLYGTWTLWFYVEGPAI